jgi:hypothetical protein
MKGSIFPDRLTQGGSRPIGRVHAVLESKDSGSEAGIDSCGERGAVFAHIGRRGVANFWKERRGALKFDVFPSCFTEAVGADQTIVIDRVGVEVFNARGNQG